MAKNISEVINVHVMTVSYTPVLLIQTPFETRSPTNTLIEDTLSCKPLFKF